MSLCPSGYSSNEPSAFKCHSPRYKSVPDGYDFGVNPPSPLSSHKLNGVSVEELKLVMPKLDRLLELDTLDSLVIPRLDKLLGLLRVEALDSLVMPKA